MKCYSLVGKKLVECKPEELYTAPTGIIVDEKEEMIRLILTPEARKKQREVLVQQTAEFNKAEFAGTFLVSHLENPDLVKSFLQEIKDGKSEILEKPIEESKKKEKKKKKAEPAEGEEPEVHILKRWDPTLVKKLVSFLDGKSHASLVEIQNHLEITEGEAYWLTQDLIYIGTLPGRWIGYDDGQWFYQIISDQPLSKEQLTTKGTSTSTSSKAVAKPKPVSKTEKK